MAHRLNADEKATRNLQDEKEQQSRDARKEEIANQAFDVFFARQPGLAMIANRGLIVEYLTANRMPIILSNIDLAVTVLGNRLAVRPVDYVRKTDTSQSLIPAQLKQPVIADTTILHYTRQELLDMLDTTPGREKFRLLLKKHRNEVDRILNVV